jgi:hypothetical protein
MIKRTSSNENNVAGVINVIYLVGTIFFFSFFLCYQKANGIQSFSDGKIATNETFMGDCAKNRGY